MTSTALVLATTAISHAAAQDRLPSPERMWEIIQQQQKRIEELEKKQSSTERKVEATGSMVENVANQAQRSQGWFDRTHIGGYGEIHFLSDDSLVGAEGGEGGEGDHKITAKRFVLAVGHEFNDRLRFFSEIELENALVIGGEGGEGLGEVELEQFFIEYDVTDRHSLAAGVQLIPVGIINETHEPPTFFGVERNLVERRIIPSTWREAAVGARGQLGSGFSYDVMVHSGLNATQTGGEGGEAGNAFLSSPATQSVSNAAVQDGAATARLEWSGMPGVNLALAGQYQSDITQNRDGVSATLFVASADVERGPWGLRALYARWDLFGDASIRIPGGQPISLSQSGRKTQWGWYMEPSYTFDLDSGQLGVFARYLQVDDQADADMDSQIDEVSVGINYWLHPDVVLKADYRHQMFEDDRDDKGSFNIGLGLQY